MPGSVIRRINDRSSEWNKIAAINKDGVKTGPDNFGSYEELANGWQINRSIPLTGKWDAIAWEPCYKLI